MIRQDYKDQIVWIVGASSGIGLSLARELSDRGATLALSARRENDLYNLKNELDDRHRVFALDVADSKMVFQMVQKIHVEFGRIDRVVFMSATYTPPGSEKFDTDVMKKIIETNLVGAFNVVYAAIPFLKNQNKKGQIALCGSVAGYIGLPGGQPYSATKAAIINLSESLYAEYSDDIDIKVINPGFVRTPLTDKNKFKMPMIIEPEQAARAIADGLLSRRFEIHFPKKFTFFVKILALLPYTFSLYVIHQIKQ